MDMTFDGTFAYSGVHVGSHTLNGWLVRADHRKIAGTDARRALLERRRSGGLYPPTDSIRSPAGTSVSGVVSVAATRGDAVGVYGVQFTLDGVSFGIEDVISPYRVNWDTTTRGQR